jgi:hypothetical protein
MFFLARKPERAAAFQSGNVVLFHTDRGGLGGGGGGGARAPPPNFYGRAKSNAKFGQNLKISEKFWKNVLKKFLYFRENDVC